MDEPSTSAQIELQDNASLKGDAPVSFEELLLSTVKSHSSVFSKKS